MNIDGASLLKNETESNSELQISKLIKYQCVLYMERAAARQIEDQLIASEAFTPSWLA